MRPHRNLASLLLLAAAVVPGVHPAACRADDGPTPPSSVAPGSHIQITGNGISLDFAGGTIAQLVAAVNSAGLPFNVIAQNSDMLASRLPSFSFRAGHPEDVNGLAGIVEMFVQPQGLAFRQVGPANFIVQKEDEPRTSGLAFDFPGGTISQLLAALSRLGFDFNVVAERPDLMAVPIPAFSVANLRRDDAGGAIGNIVNMFIRPKGLTCDQVGQNVFLLQTKDPNPHPESGKEEFGSFPLESLLLANTVETVTDAIRTAWTMDPKRDPSALQLKFHPPTKLLLVTGPEPAIAITASVLQALKPTDETSQTKPLTRTPQSQ